MEQPLWKAGGACPQCGAGVELDVGDPILACPYCRTHLYLSCPGPLRYRLEASLRDPGLFYLPFWRFRGLRFRVVAEPKGVHGTLLDATVPAWPEAPSAANLGVRPQVGGLRLDGGGPGRSDERPVDVALEEAVERVDWLDPSKAAFTRFIGETQSIIEAPFLLESGRQGARLREALPDGKAYDLDPQAQTALQAFLGQPRQPDRLSFLPLLCPECGHGLPSDPYSVAFLCGQCARAWRVETGGLAPLPYAASPGSEQSRLFPFWELAFTAEGLPLRTRADLRRWAASYQAIPPGWADEACRALVPGFKVHPQSFLRLAKVLTLASLELPDTPLSPSRPFRAEPVRLPHTEAAQAVKVILASLVETQKRAFPAVPSAKLRVSRARLVYLPFVLRGWEWIQEGTGLAMQATSVTRGAGL